MSGWKKSTAVALILLIVLSVAGGFFWYNAETANQRNKEISTFQYEKLQNKMLDNLGRIPFQGSTYPQDTQKLKITELTEADVAVLGQFPELRTLDARGCEAYALLQTVRNTYPDLSVWYSVTIGGKKYPQDAKILRVDGMTEAELSLLPYLPQLERVYLETGKNPEQLGILVEICAQRQIPVQVSIGNHYYDMDVTRLETAGTTAEEMALVYLLPQLKQVRFVEPMADAGSLLAYAITHPDVDVQWEKAILGVLCTRETEELDLTAGLSAEGALAYEQAAKAPIQGTRDPVPYLFKYNSKYPLPDMARETAAILAQVEQGLLYFPNVKTVFVGGCLLDNEAMADFREAHRQDYKVIWSVQMGDKVVARTDTPYFMPTKFHAYYFLDRDAENLKYCEDIVSIDLGHMAVSDISWVSYMPKLQYLVLAHSQVQYIEPIRSCKNLKFLELDWSPIRDFTPLQDCTSLEDLNIGQTFADVTPIGEMTWLRNLWMVGCSSSALRQMSEALPHVKMVRAGTGTVAGGWRDLPNYYAMRDCMGMFYMTW